MTDQPATPTAPKRHPWRWLLAGVALCALLAAGGWYLAGRRVYTDDRSIHVRASGASIREILWTVPKSLGERFNTPDHDYEPSISPDGNELLFVRGKAGRNAEIYVSRRAGKDWSDPVPLTDINTPHDDLGPRLTGDGRFLVFYSDRPGGHGGYDLWAAQRNADGSFAAAFNLGPNVNTEFNEYSPAPTPDGKRLYFATNRKAQSGEQQEAWRATIRQDANGDYDLFVVDRIVPAPASSGGAPPSFPLSPVLRGEGRGGGPATTQSSDPQTQPADAQPPTPTLPPEYRGEGEMPLAFHPATELPALNTPHHEGAACVSPAGDFLYFASNRPGGAGRFDLYRSRLKDDGSLSPPENLGRQVNTAENETDPQLATGGFHLYFSSDRAGAEARGGYDLLSSESREVYVMRQERNLPQIGWSWWFLLAGLLLLLPLLFFLRGWDDRRLGLLQRCLLVSLLVHVLLTILLSLIFVSREIVNYVRAGDGAGMEVAMTLEPAGGIDVGDEVRRQFTETPVDMPEPAEETQARVAATDFTEFAPAPVEVSVPAAGRPPADAMMVQVPAPSREAPAPISEPVAVAPPSVTQAPVPQLEFAAPRLRTAEQEVRPTAEAVPVARSTSGAPAPSAPQEIAQNVGATSVQPESLVQSPDLVRPNLMSIAPPVVARPAESAAVQPDLAGPSIPSVKVAAAAPQESQGTEPAGAGLERQTTESTTSSTPVGIETSVPAAGTATAASTSLASAAPVQPQTIQPADDVKPAPAVPAGGGAVMPSVPAPGVAKAVAAPSPTLAATEATPSQERAAPAAAGGTTQPSKPADVGVASAAPVRPDAARTDLAPAGPSTRPVVATEKVAIAAAVPEAAPAMPDVKLPAGRRAGPVVAAKEPGLPASADEASLASARVAAPTDAGPRGAPALPGPAAAPAARPDSFKPNALASGDLRPRGGEIVPVPLNLEVAIAAPRLAAPQPLSQRAPEARKPLVEKLGGTKQSEESVDRALAYLARQQEPDGRWTYVLPGRRPGRGRTPHDMALTGLATLCFLAADHTPDKPGPYREVVQNGIEFLIARQRDNGDLRGPMAGGGADAGNMYDHGIATLALAEAALMTGDPRTTAAALKAAQFIVDAQNGPTGGWRYLPKESGDTSIFGWQIMALHSATQLGFEIPRKTRDGALRYVRIASAGRHRGLGSYTPGSHSTPAMTAELLFSRILLGDDLTSEAEEEASRYITRNAPSEHGADFYCWYYASLSLMQLQNEVWKGWNERTRETLVRMQQQGGEDDGCWHTNIMWGDRGGRIYSTSLACLTLQVYYRYLPVDPERSTSRPATPDIGYLSR